MNDKGMTATDRETIIKDRTIGCHFLIEHRIPFCNLIILTIQSSDKILVHSKILRKGFC